MRYLPTKISMYALLGGSALVYSFMSGCGGDATTSQTTGSGSTSSSSSGAGGAGGNGQGGMGECTPGQVQGCYSGPAGTENVGLCKEGTETCGADGTWGACTGEVQPATGAEACDGLDNNCDGQVDDGCACVGGSTQTCYSGPMGTEGVGACKAGTQTCTNNAWGPCVGSVEPATEDCDGLDNDCNGVVDNDLGTLTCGVGACVATVSACVNGQAQQCVPNSPSPEACNGIDDDCDMVIDDGNPGGGMVCSTGLQGVCAAGNTACENGGIVCKAVSMPSNETCNGLDDDCDGQIDESNPGGGVACNTGLQGVCASGLTQCSNGSIKCQAINMPTAEICNGLDDNCTGQVDEGNPGGNMPCTTGLPGICNAGTTSCTGGAIKCNQNQMAGAEVCGDNADNDCDGMTDEGCCIPVPEVCGDNIDNDCDGVIDDGCCVPMPEICGDNIDNDCDNLIDESCCGNGVLDAGEVCDDGDQINTDACTNMCTKGPLVVAGNALTYINSALAQLGESYNTDAAEWGTPSSQGVVIVSHDGGNVPSVDYLAHLNAGAHLLLVGGTAIAAYPTWVNNYVNTDNTASWHQASDCSPDWSKVGVHPITQFMPQTHEFTNPSVSYHMLHFTSAQPANTQLIGQTCHNAAAPYVLVTRKFSNNGTFTYMALDLGPYNDATSQNLMVAPFLQGYLAYVRSL